MCTCEELVTHTGPVWPQKDVLARNLVGMGMASGQRESLPRGETRGLAAQTHSGPLEALLSPTFHDPFQAGYPRPGDWGNIPALSQGLLPSSEAQMGPSGFWVLSPSRAPVIRR